MMAPDSDDPFGSDDPAARERERRRQERERRRQQRRGEPRAPEGPGAEGPPELGREARQSRAPEGRDPTVAAGSGHAPAQRRATEEPAEAPRRPRRAGSTPAIRRRRLIALGALVAAVGLLVVAISALGGEEAEEPEPAATVATTEVTIPEGLTIDQIDEVAKDAGLRGNYKKAAKRAKGFKPRRFGADDPPNLEGFLFPATYELEQGARVTDLVARQLDAFRERIRGVRMREARAANLTPYEVLIIASMIEREVMVPSERRKVAAVIYNRLADGEPLGIDSTIRYEDRNYEEPLTESRLATDSPYNTRTRAGLPPTPIGNPGLDSIEAAARPADADFRYFVIKPGTCGEHVFTASDEEFQRAAARYQRALEREGGSPTECPGDEG